MSSQVPFRTLPLPRRRAVHDVGPSRAEIEEILLEDLHLLEPHIVHSGPEYPEEPLVLIVSRERAATLPKLRELLRGEPEISIVVDRRIAERRGDGDADPPVERRVAERRRRFSFYLL